MSNENKIVVLPLGAHEYHGPHLPFDTDYLIAEAFANRIKQRLPYNIDAHFLSAEPIGYSREHMRNRGTKTLSYSKAIEDWIQRAEIQYKKGFRKIILLNAHGGNSPLMTIIATELRARFNMLAVTTSFSRFGLPENMLTPEEKALDIHGGFIETSVMLAIAPDKVDMSQAQNFTNKQSEYSQQFEYLRAYGKHAFGWMIQDINPLGAAGAAIKATSDAGDKILDYITTEALKLFADVDKFDINKLK